jgi:hypothetical protein
MTSPDETVILDGFLDEQVAPGPRDDTARFRILQTVDEDHVDEAVLPCVVAIPELAHSILTERKRGDLLRITGRLQLPQTPDGAMWVDVHSIDLLHPTLFPDPYDDEVRGAVLPARAPALAAPCSGGRES